MDTFPLSFSLQELLDRQREADAPWVECLRSFQLSAGLYVLRPGQADPQRPHSEDEVYVVVEGRASFTAGDRTQAVAPGDLLFVPARVPHRFHDVREELRVAVVFAPPEGSRAEGAGTAG